jgi:L-ascorbate metabolism protein UlaG (beta-lactamase superfamily)
MARQARAPETQPFGVEAFEAGEDTVLRWLGMAGFLINSRGTTVMIDPLLGGFDMPVMIEFPIAAGDVPTWMASWSHTAITTTTACLRVVILPR